ncbi:hypothetical protein PVAP13_1KG377000 [Panicum virgatum]|uniref:Leucine-rich repeat-containing N-terminal plant-type domain-containing protein n=2 Tax=Panicum virgatum TaxID=38727 RepID=A0A8T0XDY3_PANVG|nr:hypothetical protein PVAP13_1KG377000 [Panicum virgatum]
MLLSLALLLLCQGTGHLYGHGHSSRDMLALLDFKKAISGNKPNRALSSWNTSTPFFQWKGVLCSTEHPGRVVKLHLHHQGLSGPISPYLGNLTLLRELNLSRNNLSGRLPPLNRLHALEVIDLAENSLRGTIPGKLNPGYARKLFQPAKAKPCRESSSWRGSSRAGSPRQPSA